ncbi:unnamed protein product, partial [marine sediment metagenome]
MSAIFQLEKLGFTAHETFINHSFNANEAFENFTKLEI